MVQSELLEGLTSHFAWNDLYPHITLNLFMKDLLKVVLDFPGVENF